jgi:SAM-dependent methyltransferase
MSLKEDFYPESRFGGFTDIDGTVVFYNRVRSLLSDSSVVVDFGCGAGALPSSDGTDARSLKHATRSVLGLDVDPAALANRRVDEVRLLEGSTWPVDSGTVDLCLCDNVLEHLPEPGTFFGECRRVLKDGGHVCVRTPNARSYFGLVSRLVPNRHHHRVTTRVQADRPKEDVFPTLYRCNTVGRIRRMLASHGFDHAVYGYEAEPSYLEFSRLAYRFGVLHQRYAPRSLRVAIFAFGRASR